MQEAAGPPDDLPSPTPGGIHVWQLSKFPLACPLGHVQLYVAAAAAAAGQPLSISVGLAKVLPHRPVAWVEMDSNVAFHPKHSQRKSPMIDGSQPVYLPSQAAISALPAPAQAPGDFSCPVPFILQAECRTGWRQDPSTVMHWRLICKTFWQCQQCACPCKMKLT